MSAMPIQQLRANAERGQPDAQFLLSQLCRQNNDVDGMLHWLKLAASKKLPDALGALGRCHEKGHGVRQDYAVAVSHYDRAIASGSVVAAYDKAELLYKSKRAAAQQELIRELLVLAAKARVIPALRAIGFLGVQSSSSRHLGVACLRQAAYAGDTASQFILAWSLLVHENDEILRSEAMHWANAAAAARFPLTSELAGGGRDTAGDANIAPPASSIDYATPFALFPAARLGSGTRLNEEPAVALFDDVLTVADRAYLMGLARPSLQRADVIDPQSHHEGMVSDVRTSMSTYLPFCIVDIISRYVEMKIIGETGEELECSEPMSVLHYSPGEYYRPHVDYFNPKLNVSKQLLEDGGQRTASAVTYLTAPTEGGGTSFPRLKLTVPAIAGSTLWFRNCFADGRIDDRSLHAGDTVTDGDKWVVTKWFRERPTRYLEY